MKGIVWGVIALCILLIGIVGFVSADISIDDASNKVLNYSNNQGMSATIVNMTDKVYLYEIYIEVNNQKIPVYVTKDGNYMATSIITLNPDSGSAFVPGNELVTSEIAEQNLLDFSKKNGLNAVIINSSYEDPFFTIVINTGSQFPVYVTKDGKYMASGGLINLNNYPSSHYIPPKPIPTSDKPIVKLYVYSHCPYGIQFEKALSPVYDLLKNDANIDIVAIGAMHGEFEHTESLRQISIEQLYGRDKLFDYLKEFDTNSNIGSCSGDVACLDKYISAIYTKLGINKNDVETYMKPSAEKIYQSQNKDAIEADISGSPTFVINGEQVSIDSRSPESIKQAVCNAFISAPSECSTKLSSKATTPGFGGVAISSHCGKLIYFCSDDSPYCNMTAPVIEEYASSSGCVEVTKHLLSSFMNLNKDPLALKYNVQGVPTFIFIDEETGCFSDIGAGGGTKVEDIKNKITNFRCDGSQQQDNQCPIYTCEGGYKPKCSFINGQCSCESCPSKIIPNESSGPIEIPPTNSSEDNGKSIINPVICQGCSSDSKCYPYGFRKDKNYCDDKTNKFIIQTKPDTSCENNFECDSNLCVNSQCVSGDLWSKMMRWFGKLFGSK